MEIKNKRAELTTTQLVTIIILIVSFVIILFLIFKLNLGQTTNEEICRNSVILRGKSVIKTNLDCRTSYVTISSENKSVIMKEIAEEMASCWSQFGEGKIDYGSDSTNAIHYAICSIINFDTKTQQKVSEITYSEFYNFLNAEKRSSSQTYLQYLYGLADIGSFSPQEQVKISLSQDKILTNQEYSIITGIDNGFSILDDSILNVYIIPTSETSSRLEENREFITKA